MTGDEDKVCKLFEQIEEQYKKFEKRGAEEQHLKFKELNAELLNEFIDEMGKFEGSEKFMREMRKAFEKIDNSDEDSEDEFSAATDEWIFNLAVCLFGKFTMKVGITRKITTDPPTASGQQLPQVPNSTLHSTLSVSAEEAAKLIESLHEKCSK